MTWSLEEVTQPISCNLCEQEFGDLQTYYAHARLTPLPFPAPTIRGSSSTAKMQQATRKTWTRGSIKRDGSLGAEEQQIWRQLRRTASRTKRAGGASGSTTVVAKAQSRQQARVEEPQQDRAQGHPQDASDDARPVLDGVGHSADQSVEPRSRQHAETDADLRTKDAARGTRTHTRTTIRVGKPGLDQVSSAEAQHGRHANGTRPIDVLGPIRNSLPHQICDEFRFCRPDKTCKADTKRIKASEQGLRKDFRSALRHLLMSAFVARLGAVPTCGCVPSLPATT